MKIWCKLFGHDWIFPYRIMLSNSRRIKASDYKCDRCGARREKLFMEELLENE